MEEPSTSGPQFVCVNCLSPSETLYTEYSPGVIKITECKKCGRAVDKYVEYDLVLVLIDLILQYSTAYRHLLLNVTQKHSARLVTIFLLAGAYDQWISRRAAELGDFARVYDLEWKFYESLLQSFLEMSIYAFSVLALSSAFTSKRLKSSDERFAFLQAALIGFYGNVFIVFSIIWKLHNRWSYRMLTQLLIVVSHVQHAALNLAP
ncbi:Protein R05H5.5 [Aphelenchoides avenae]|nr:Protein R05H5.5 [Aphelenchus avenae]